MSLKVRRAPFLLAAVLSSACGMSDPVEFSTPGPVAADGDNELAPAEAAAGWQLLFDGTSLQHWRSYNQAEPHTSWQAHNGVLVLTQGGGGDLITRTQWTDFELKLDWYIVAGRNSGIFFLADESELPIYVHAPEIQLLDDARHADRHKPNHRSGSLYDMITAPPESQLPAEQWNTLRMHLQNRHLQIWQNEVQTVDIVLGSERWQALVADSKFSDWSGFGDNLSGHIGLQDHGDRVAFKNLKIRTLSVQ